MVRSSENSSPCSSRDPPPSFILTYRNELREVSPRDGPKTLPPMSRRSILQRLAREARPYYPRIGLAMALGVLAGVLSIVPPLAFRIIINQVLIPLGGRPPDLRALYLSLGLTSVALILANAAI